MADLIVAIVFIVILSALAVPTIILFLARVGLFEPVSVRMFGRAWYFAPQIKVVSTSGAGTQRFSQDSWIMVGTVSTFLAVVPPENYSGTSIDRGLRAARTQTFLVAAISQGKV